MTTLYDSRGGIVTLGRLVGSGGEAEVFEITTMPGFVAKKYRKPISVLQQNKLRAMLTISNTELHKIAAWPNNTLHEHPNAQACGLIMRKVSGKDIHVLYSPAQRKQIFPKADWNYLIHAAMNCAAAFDALHKVDVIVGDVNQSNIIVTDDMVVTLIDCDSFQIKINGALYPCEVGQALYTPPELQNRNFTEVYRTQNHDRFGLAVLIFHLLFMGRHPFSGQYLGKGDMSIEKAIKEHRFAYGSSAGHFQMNPPIHSLKLSDVPKSIGSLFEKAFASTSAISESRPSAIEWFNALNNIAVSMRRCSVDKSHAYGTNLSTCPWCALIQGGAPNFFLSPMPNGVSGFNLIYIWEKIDQIIPPSSVYINSHLTELFTPTLWPLLSTPPIEPVKPEILTAPPDFPKLILPPPKFKNEPIKPMILVSTTDLQELILPPLEFEKPNGIPDSTQNLVRFIALGFGLMSPVLALVGTAIGVPGIGNAFVNAIIIGFSLLIVSGSFAAYWMALEKNRKIEYDELKRLHENEIIERKLIQVRHFENIKIELAKQKDEEMIKYEIDMRNYKREVDQRKRIYDEYQSRCIEQLNYQKAVASKDYEKLMQDWEAKIVPYRMEAKRRRDASKIADAHLKLVEGEWASTATSAVTKFSKKKGELAALKAKHAEIDAQRTTQWQQLQERAREFQKRHYLDNYFIDAAPTIGGIGPMLKATLASFGIETANDIEIQRLEQLPSGSGFGRKRIEALLDWRKKIEAKFLYNPSTGVPKHEKLNFESKFQQLLQPIQQQLLNGHLELQNIKQSAEAELDIISTKIKNSSRNALQMEANVKSIPKGL
jgi:DNA-binding helix-hairpin-helix protein with protein kinase domain